MAAEIETRYMLRALELARKAAGGVSPRPPVGAVIVKDGAVAGEGSTEPRPGRHAEVVALHAAGGAARGADMYCTLEPHSYQGVSAPCTEQIVAAGIARVICPLTDPHPKVDGDGFSQLRAAGVEVVTDAPGPVSEAAREMVAGFARLVATSRPLVTAKFAMSLDGKIATRTGDSRWITGAEARRAAHEMRRTSDAVITGIGTVLADDPRLTARGDGGAHTGRPRLRVVVDTCGRLPADAALLKQPGEILWVRGRGRADDAARLDGAEQVDLPATSAGVDLDSLVDLLGERQCGNVLIEAGGRLTGAFFDAGLVDRVACFVAPVVIGGGGAPGPVGGDGAARLTDALRLARVRHETVGADLLITGYVDRG